MEVNWIVIIILAVIIISIVIIVFSFLINPSAISNFLKEACLLTVGKIFANPKVCEAFRV